MEIIQKRTLLSILSRNEIEDILDREAQTVEIMNCPSCSYPILYNAAIINQEQSRLIDEVINRFNEAINETVSAAEKIYGCDVRLKGLAMELSKIKEKYSKTNLSVIEGRKTKC